jgi:hypothetical protein
VSRRFELSVTPKKVVSRGFQQEPYRITHILLPNAECIAGASLMSWSIQISKMILPTIFGCGFGAKALPRLFRGPQLKVSAHQRVLQEFRLESLLRRIPFNIATFAIHSTHVLEGHRSRLFIAPCWSIQLSLPFSHCRKLAYISR